MREPRLCPSECTPLTNQQAAKQAWAYVFLMSVSRLV